MATAQLVLILATAITALVGVVVTRRRAAERRLVRLRAAWGQWPDRDRDMAAIGSAYRHVAAAGPSDRWLDDRTWDDLNMDSVFTVLDRTVSVVGRQALYARLRSSPMGDHLDAFEALVTRLSTDARARETAQLTLARLGDAAGYDIWRLAQPGSIRIESWYLLFPSLTLTMVVALILVMFWPPAGLMLIAGAITNIVLRSTVARQVAVVQSAFRQVGPLVSVAEKLAVIDREDTRPITGALVADPPKLARLKRIAGWMSRDTSSAMSGQIGGLLFEYLNMIFCLDANALLFGAKELRDHGPELLRVLASVGDVDAALSVASYRAETAGWTLPRFLSAGEPSRLTGVRHPLVPGAVANSITIDAPRGMIITGSNMSGKTTFLRTVGVTTVLAQTINTCLVDAYESPRLVVRSCIGRADDPAHGKSYYAVEVEAVLSLVRASEGERAHLFLFDELFRGTNTVERIAAGEAVLRALIKPSAEGQRSPHIVMAATHDQELVDLLAETYAAYHFTDTVGEEGLNFDYRLLPGPSTTRNAITLLRLRGASEELVSQAMARAHALGNAWRHPVAAATG